MFLTGSSTTESFLASMLPWLMEPWLRSNTYSQWNKNSRSCRWCYCHHQNKGWYFCGPCWSFRTAKRYYCFQWPDKKDTANLYLLICMANFVASELFLLHIMQMTLCGTHLWSFETRYRDLKTFLIHELSSQEISVVTLVCR